MKFRLAVLLLLTYVNTSLAWQNGTVESPPVGQASGPGREFYIEQAKGHMEKSKSIDIADIGLSAEYRRHVSAAMRNYEMAGQERNHPFMYLLLGMSCYHSNMPDSSIIYLTRALGDYPENPNIPRSDIEQKSYLFLAHNHRERGEPYLALEYGHKLHALATELQDSVMIFSAGLLLGMTYADVERQADAVEHYARAGRVAEAIGDYHSAYPCYIAISSIYANQWNGHEALAAAESALRCAEKTGDPSALVGCLTVKGVAYYVLEKYEDTVKLYEQALQHYEEVGDEENYNIQQASLAGVLAKMGRHDEAYHKIRSPYAENDLVVRPDAPIFPGSYDDLKFRMMESSTNAVHERLKYEILDQEFLIREARSLRLRIWFISVSAVLIISLLLLLYNRQRQKAKAEKAARYAQEKEAEYLSLQQDSELRMIRQYIDGLESERARISKELHDGVCNDLLGLEMELRNNGDNIREQAEFLRKTRENIRNVSHELMPPAFQYASIDEVLADYIAHYHAPDSAEIRYTHTGTDWNEIPKDVAFEIYRITQEALSNSIKHSQANKIDVSLTRENNNLTLEIRDNGSGFDTSSRGMGIGLRTIRERVESISGKLQIDTDNNGTAIRVVF